MKPISEIQSGLSTIPDTLEPMLDWIERQHGDEGG